jgi:nitrate reductase gamma subunit
MLAMAVVVACCFFGARRIMLPEVRFVTRTMDWLVLAIVVLPFLTGILAYHQILNYDLMLILHIVSGEIMLAAIPFTRLSHMLFGFASRAYMGSEFGAVRHARDW